MSEENVEIVRRILAAWDREDTEAVLALVDPEIEYVNAPDAVEPGTRRGHDELAAVLRSQWEGLAGARREIDRLHSRGDEVITELRLSLPMPGSAARIEAQALASWRFCDSVLIRLEVLGVGSSFQKAIEAAGLSE